ncbi:HEAT repeat domain-containing protein, partial [bacterium]|nr:HEAT repeat domain-containing protein [bacterium]
MKNFDELLETLRSKDPSIRFLTLSRLENLSATPAMKGKLKDFFDGETDPSIRFYLNLMIGSPFDAETESNPEGTLPALIEELRECLEAGNPDFLHFFLRLKGVPAIQMPIVVDLFRSMRWSEFPTEVLPFFLKLVRDFGSPIDVPVLEELCRHPNPHVISLAVDALAKMSPDRIETMLVPLLTNPSPGVRSQAIKNLLKLDPIEALKHYEAMLFSRDPTEKQMALFHAYFFPFEKIESAMLKFISFEQDAGLIAKAGHLFIINPSPETPLRLLDLFEHSTGPKKSELQRIILELIRFLEKTGEISQPASQFLDELKKTYIEKKNLQVVYRCKNLLNSRQIEDRLKAIEKLIELKSRGNVGAANLLSEHSQTETDPGIRNRLDEWNRVQQFSFDECLTRIRSFNREEYHENRAWVQSLFQEVTNERKAVLLRFIVEFEGKEALALILTCLRSTDPAILAGAIELGTEFPNHVGIIDKALELTNHDEADVRSSAFKTLSVLDKDNAINLCRQWMLSSQTKRRLEGLHIAASFDFPAIRGTLLECLAVERDSENLSFLFSIFAAHLNESLFLEIVEILSKFPEALQKWSEENLMKGTEGNRLLERAKSIYNQEKKVPGPRREYSL